MPAVLKAIDEMDVSARLPPGTSANWSGAKDFTQKADFLFTTGPK